MVKTKPNLFGREKSWEHSPTLSFSSHPLKNDQMKNWQVMSIDYIPIGNQALGMT